jgi:hypothetical protein
MPKESQPLRDNHLMLQLAVTNKLTSFSELHSHRNDCDDPAIIAS